MVSLREKFPLENIKPLKKTISSFLAYLIVIIFISIFLFVSGTVINPAGFSVGLIITIIVILLIILLVIKYIYEVFYMKYYFYDSNKDNLIIQKGVFSRNEITLPFKRIQDVYVDQDILDRIFGLYDLHVSSATTVSGYLSHIDGLNKENSEAIKQLILKSVHRKDGSK